MKKVFIFLGVLTVVSMPMWVTSAPRKYQDVIKSSRNDGDTMSPIYVSCSSTTWTTLVDVNLKRRVAKITTIASADVVCLSTAVAGTDSCSATEPGYRLQAQLPYEHASEAILKCRALDTKAAVAVYGIDYSDSGDASTIQ